MTPDELPIADGGPCDPDRAWAWRDLGDGAEPPIGPVDTDYSYALAMARYPSLVRDVKTTRVPDRCRAHRRDERRPM